MFRKMIFVMCLLTLPLPAAAQEESTPTVFYEAAFIPMEFALNVRSTSGHFSQSVDVLQNGEAVEITSAAEAPNGIPWVPISFHDGASGWVERRFVTGHVGPAAFCSDARVLALVVALQEAVRNQDGAWLAEIVSPRGLYIAQHSDTNVHLTSDEVANFFVDTRPRTWQRRDIGLDSVITESLAEEVTAKLQRDLLPEIITITCNDNQDGLSLREYLYAVDIPGYDIRNFYAVKRPGEPGNELDWGAWGLVIEYWDDQPVLMALGYYVWLP